MVTSEFLLLAAISAELAGLNERPPDGWRIALTGIGGVTAAIATARMLEKMRPRKILFVGTCGTYDNRLRIGDCIAVSEVQIASIQELLGRAFRPPIEATWWPATWSLPLPSYRVACPPAITSDADDAALLSRIAEVENLELAGVFAACHQAEIPVAAALAVANYVGPEAHDQWVANNVIVSKNMVEKLLATSVFTRNESYPL